MAYSSDEVKSGMLISIALVVLIVLTFVVGNLMSKGGQPVQVEFGYISGLEDNAPVYFAGYEVGKVDKIDVREGLERPVLITIKIADHVRLRQDSQAYIDTLGMMGEKFVELTPGSGAVPLLKWVRLFPEPIP